MNVEYFITSKNYTEKPNRNECRFLEFDKKNTDVEEFINYVTSGYGFTCSILTDKSHISNKGDRRQINFKYSYLVCLDVDDSKYSMNEAFDIVSLKPTFSYNTYSNDESNKIYKFRFIYVFSKPIDNVDLYYSLMVFFNNKISKDLGISTDKKTIDCARYFNGTMDKNICKTNIIYNVEDIIKFDDFKELKIKKNKAKSPKIEDKKELNSLEKFFFENSYISFLEEFSDKVTPSQTCSTLPVDDSTVPFVLLPTDFREIKRIWFKSNDKFKIRKIKNGEKRRNSLFVNGIIRRMINPSLTFDDILYALTFEMVNYIDNSEDKIIKQDIWNISKNVMKADINDEKFKDYGRCRKTAVNPNFYLLKKGFSKKDVIKKHKSYKRYIVESLYEYGLNDKQQAEYINNFLKENNISLTITKYAVRNFRFSKDENGEYLHPDLANYNFKKSIKDVIKLIFNDYSSTNDLLNGIKDNGFDVKERTLYRYLDELNLSYTKDKTVSCKSNNCQKVVSNIYNTQEHINTCNKMAKTNDTDTIKEKRYKIIKENFDKCKTSNDLLKVLMNNNLKISRITLFRDLKELGISFKDKNKKEKNYTEMIIKEHDENVKEVIQVKSNSDGDKAKEVLERYASMQGEESIINGIKGLEWFEKHQVGDDISSKFERNFNQNIYDNLDSSSNRLETAKHITNKLKSSSLSDKQKIQSIGLTARYLHELCGHNTLKAFGSDYNVDEMAKLQPLLNEWKNNYFQPNDELVQALINEADIHVQMIGCMCYANDEDMTEIMAELQVDKVKAA